MFAMLRACDGSGSDRRLVEANAREPVDVEYLLAWITLRTDQAVQPRVRRPPGAGPRSTRSRGAGYVSAHYVVDDRTRLAYVELHPDQQGETCDHRGRTGPSSTDRCWRRLLADRAAPPKQRHSARRIWRRLVEERGAGVAEVTVRRHVRARRRELGMAGEAFVPQIHPAGAEAEVDWGEATMIMRARPIPSRPVLPARLPFGPLLWNRPGQPALSVVSSPRRRV
jgi:hypothetical protein